MTPRITPGKTPRMMLFEAPPIEASRTGASRALVYATQGGRGGAAPGRGIAEEWACSLARPDAARVLSMLRREDEALVSAFPALALTPRSCRLAVGLMGVFAARRGLTTAELALLHGDAQRDALGALAALEVSARRPRRG